MLHYKCFIKKGHTCLGVAFFIMQLLEFPFCFLVGSGCSYSAVWGNRKNEKGRNKENKGHKPSRGKGYRTKIGGRRMFEKLPKVPISCQELPAALSSRCKLFQNNRKYIPEAFNSAKKHFQGHFKRGHSDMLHFTTIWRLFSGRNNILGIVDNRSLF